MKKTLRILYNLLKWSILSLLSLTATYLLIAVVLSVIPVNQHEKPVEGTEIYLLSNGIHLAIVLPVQHELKDWGTDIWIDSRIANRVRWISFGWGDKGFYFNTPEWADLTISTSLKALFCQSPAAIHLNYYSNLQENDRCKKVVVTSAQYKDIVSYIENSFSRDIQGSPLRIKGFQYSEFDSFYEANGSYNLFFTCNTWTNSCLKKAGLRASLWTPFDRGTLYQYRESCK
ncbi:TIGR02117 family protein [Gaoshiqia sediminis]|uniref:TIGR02117 family protein n=1 Tax=Gaoshiqia sediminis TaxID=2986998 RepID=A0AA42C565_9BACT|nr:TIGR02117 family protein [Gaoshiqia sediminis]MCW0481234.1 TIGR02117 family protein [Gaoshiqia sediminis]